MRSKILFEFEDLPWFPGTIRSAMTDYLRYFFTLTDFYNPATPILQRTIKESAATSIVDLCSGSGGPLPLISSRIAIPILLTDLYPNKNAIEQLGHDSSGNVRYSAESIDATAVPSHLRGIRTIFSGIHHFSKAGVREIIADAVRQGQPVAFFDGANKSLFTILAILIAHPIGFAVLTPFFRPFKISRLLFTYLLPVIPICTIWDGVVSIMRLHQPGQLLQIASDVSGDRYHWQAGKVRNRYGFKITYLTGIPVQLENVAVTKH